MSDFTVGEPVEAPSWHAIYPIPRSLPEHISPDSVLYLLQDANLVAGQHFVLIDLRRNDHSGGTIAGSLNIPAQTLWSSLPFLYNLFHAAGTQKVIWYCGSSKGRGCRAACWFADYALDQGNYLLQSLVLEGGIKGWVGGGDRFVNKMLKFRPTT